MATTMSIQKYTIPIISLFLASILFFVNPANAKWALPENIWNLGTDLDEMILNLTNWLLGFIAMASVVALIWGGLNYVTASGDTQKADLSKRIIYYAFIGIFVAGVAYAIVSVVVSSILK